MTIIPRSLLLPLLRYSHARCISSTPHVRSAGWVDKIKGVFTGKSSSSSSSFSLTNFVDQMDKARSMGMVNVSASFNKQSAILRYLASVDPTGENLKNSHKQDATVHCSCTISEVENALSKYTWAKEAQQKIDKLKEEGKPTPTSLSEVQKLMGSTPVDVGKGGKLGRNSPCSCGSGKKYKRCCGPP
ncbi:uncharacterized protein M6B38_346170 [Iris pallida]|uniref:Uncharacterized protein n=1 Tax=Iris pallida TaxID=29817 RepID=A0AAX6EFU6_IRIPA|nr:uncharacterized protein M6B38_190475 [Iris pallida]KAJ6832281.1 uncharacterized protein M6B38_346170 [Iris pallida]